MKILFHKLASLVGTVAFWSSYLLPRSHTIWIFGAWYGERYSDNPKYLFEYVSKEKKDIKCYWITKNKNVVLSIRQQGFNAFHKNSLKGVWICLRASVVVVSHHAYSDTNAYLLGGAKIVQLYHGIPLKRIGYDYPPAHSDLTNGKFAGIRSFIQPFKVFSTSDMLISTSQLVSQNFVTALRVSIEKIRVLGYPRNDILLSNDSYVHPFVRGVQEKYSCSRIFAYLPTYSYDLSGEPSIGQRELGFDGEKVNEALQLLDGVLLFRVHPFLWNKQSGGSPFSVNSETTPNKTNRIVWAGDNELDDFQPVLRHVDILITDYSSVYFDFLLLNRPIIFLTFGDDWRKNERGFYHNYDEVTPGPKARNWEEAMDYVTEACAKPGHYEAERGRLRTLFRKFVDDKSSERVFREIQKLVEPSA